MAGIAGIIAAKQPDESVESMLAAIEHRGPDSIRLHRSGHFHGGVRASVLSAQRGDGFATDGQVAVLFDGEIYNQRDADVSDAQVVLELYRTYGRTFASHLEGVFACAVQDGDGLMLARDAVGVRPLYWGTTAQGSLCFASEAKALVGVSDDVADLPPGTT